MTCYRERLLGMKTVSVRDVQRRFREVMELIACGQNIEVTRRGEVIARISPPPAPKAPRRPDFMARLRKTFPAVPKGRSLSQIVSEERGLR